MTTRRTFMIGLGAFAAVCTGGLRAQYLDGIGGADHLDLGNQGVLYRTTLPVAHGVVRCTAAVLPRASFHAAIVQQSSRPNSAIALSAMARKANARVAINGGRFNGAFQPDGLLMIDGGTIGRKRADWNGFLTIDSAGRPSVTTQPDLQPARSAVQGWPTLLDRGALAVTQDDGEEFRRTVVAQSGDLVMAMVTSPVSYLDLAYALAQNPDAFFIHRIDTAVCLSGAATTAFYARLPGGGEVEEPAFWPDRDAVLFIPY